MSYDHKEEVQRESEGILESSNWIREGANTWRKMTAKEITEREHKQEIDRQLRQFDAELKRRARLPHYRFFSFLKKIYTKLFG